MKFVTKQSKMNERKTGSKGNKKGTNKEELENTHMRKKGLMGKSLRPVAYGLAAKRPNQQNEFEQRGREERMLQTTDIERQRKRRKYMTMRGKLENNDSMKGWRKCWTNRCV